LEGDGEGERAMGGGVTLALAIGADDKLVKIGPKVLAA
jgi:hypothetical protein